MKKPTLGLIADFSGFCPVGKYATDIANSLKDAFDISLINLKTQELIVKKDDAIFDQYLPSLLSEIKKCDLIDIHLEFGFFGNSTKKVFDRLKAIIDSGKKIVITVHSMHMDETFGPFYKSFFQFLNEASKTKPVLALVNNKKDKSSLSIDCNFSKYKVFPILYFNENKILNLTSDNIFRDPNSFIHKKLHYQVADNDIFLGYFGFYQPHKDYTTALKALALLPKNYKLIIAGSEREFEAMKQNQSVVGIANLIDQLDSQISDNDLKLMNRVSFLNDLNQDEFEKVIACVDFSIINYLETNISSSSIAAQSLQLNRKVITSKCNTFINLEEFFPNSFEMIENGNHLQLRQKILTFQNDKLANLKTSNERWKLANLLPIYLDVFNSDIVARDVNNNPKNNNPAVKTKKRNFWNKFKKRVF